MNRQIDWRYGNVVKAVSMLALCAKEMYMKILRITLAGFGTKSIFNWTRTIINAMNEFVFLKRFEGTVQCYFVGFLKLMFKFIQANSGGLLRKYFQNQFAHGGWFDVAVV